MTELTEGGTTRPAVSIVIPVFNSCQTIGPLLERLSAILEGYSPHVVLVNDGSSDASHDVCRALAEEAAGVEYVELSRNFGEHNAVMAGLHQTAGDYVIIMDDDFQNPPEEVPRLLSAAIEGGYDVTYTYSDRRYHSPLRRLGSWFANAAANVLLDKPRNLYLSSFKCLSRFAVAEIVKYRGPHPYIDGLALRCTDRVGSVAVEHARRRCGSSGYTLGKLVRLWLNLFTNFSVLPLRLSSLLGLASCALGLILGVAVVVEKCLVPDLQIGWASLAVMVTMFSGVQLLILGLVGEYLGSLFLVSNQTPQFVVRAVHKSGDDSLLDRR